MAQNMAPPIGYTSNLCGGYTWVDRVYANVR